MLQIASARTGIRKQSTNLLHKKTKQNRLWLWYLDDNYVKIQSQEVNTFIWQHGVEDKKKSLMVDAKENMLPFLGLCCLNSREHNWSILETYT